MKIKEIVPRYGLSGKNKEKRLRWSAIRLRPGTQFFLKCCLIKSLKTKIKALWTLIKGYLANFYQRFMPEFSIHFSIFLKLNVINASPNFHSLSYTVKNKTSVECLWVITWELCSCKAKGALEFLQFYFIGKDIRTAWWLWRYQILVKLKFLIKEKGCFSVFKKNKGLRSQNKAIKVYKGCSGNLKVYLPGLQTSVTLRNPCERVTYR